MGSLSFSYFLKRKYDRKISVIISLQIVTHSGCHLEKNNCFFIRIKDEFEEKVYYLGKQETESSFVLRFEILFPHSVSSVQFQVSISVFLGVGAGGLGQREV